MLSWRYIISGDDKNHSNHHRKVHDVILVYPENNKIKNSIFRDNVATEHSGDISHNMLSADKPKTFRQRRKIIQALISQQKKRYRRAVQQLSYRKYRFSEPSASGDKDGSKNQPLRHYEQGRGTQEKIPLFVYHTEKNALSPAYSRADYYCSYHFRQKYQPPEPVHIYRDNPGGFKLETYSESLKRRLKSAVNINGIDNIDII